jgi:poly(3-hydroxybutyrate) depolymerase
VPYNNRLRISILACAATLLAPHLSGAQTAAASHAVLDEAAAPGNNYDKAEFRFWLPPGDGSIKATLVLVPGSNGDGRAQAEDSVWQAFATQHRVALVGCRFTDKPHDQNFIEAYVNVSQGSGQALLDVLGRFAERSHHPEIAAAPLLLWGMSAGGQFNYEFAAWKPERVAAFVVNKGGIYYSALVSRAAREVPAVLFVGGKDLEFRTNTIVGLFAVNRRGGALWALAEEPGAAHIVGRSRDLAIVFFDEVLPLRLGAPDSRGVATLKPVDPKSGFIGDLKAKTFQAAADVPAPTGPTAWLPTARVARAWQGMMTERPFEP